MQKPDIMLGCITGAAWTVPEKWPKQIEDMGRKAVIVKANIQKVDEIRSMFDAFFKEFDHIDLLVNNAGITRMVPFLEVEEDLWEEVVNTDFKGAFFCSQMAARNMVENKIKGWLS